MKCDPSIKALILTIDKESGNKYVIEDLGDEEHLLVKNDKVTELKRTVQHVRIPARAIHNLRLTHHHRKSLGESK